MAVRNEHKKLKRYRRRAFERQGGLCFWCHQPMIVKTEENAATVWNHPRACTADHLVLRAHGGITVEENIVAACRECNNGRHWSWEQIDHNSLATLADVWPRKESHEHETDAINRQGSARHHQGARHPA